MRGLLDFHPGPKMFAKKTYNLAIRSCSVGPRLLVVNPGLRRKGESKGDLSATRVHMVVRSPCGQARPRCF
jgi:hypothetical protein